MGGGLKRTSLIKQLVIKESLVNLILKQLGVE